MADQIAPYEKIWPRGGMRAPHTRRIVIDSGNKGDFETVPEALAAVDLLAGVNTPYVLDIVTPNAAVVDVGNFTLKAGVWLRGLGRQLTLIRGTPTFHCGSRMSDLRWTPTTGSSTIMHFVNDLAGHRAVLQSVYGYLEKSQNAPIYGVKCSGSTTDALGLEFMDSKIYLANRQVSAVSAQMYPFHIETGSNTYIHFTNGVIKTSSGDTGSATAPELVWNQGQGADAYVEVTGSVWQPFYSVAPRRLRSENLLHPGGDFAMMTYLPRTAAMATDITAFTARSGADLFSGHFEQVEARTLRVGGGTVATDPPLRTGQFHAPDWMTSASTATPGVGVARSHPWRVYRDTPIDLVEIEVTTAAAGALLRLSLHADNGSGDPGARLLDLSTISGAAVGKVTAACVYTLKAGVVYHFAGGVEVAAASYRTALGNVPWLPMTGNVPSTGHTGVHSAGVTPNPFVTTAFNSAPILVKIRPA